MFEPSTWLHSHCEVPQPELQQSYSGQQVWPIFAPLNSSGQQSGLLGCAIAGKGSLQTAAMQLSMLGREWRACAGLSFKCEAQPWQQPQPHKSKTSAIGLFFWHAVPATAAGRCLCAGEIKCNVMLSNQDQKRQSAAPLLPCLGKSS